MIAQAFIEGKKYKYVILAANIIIAICFVVYLVWNLTGHSVDGKTDSFNNVVASEYTTETTMTDSSDGMSGISGMLISGTHADAGQGKVFYFGAEGIYSGYFDNQRTNVTDYTYEVVQNETGEDCVNIYNPEKTQYVQYKLGFDQESNLVLNFDENETITLMQ